MFMGVLKQICLLVSLPRPAVASLVSAAENRIELNRIGDFS